MFTREEKRRQRQEEVLLLLDMRLACLLVDQGGSEALRKHLSQLRRKLEQELLDSQTLGEVEYTVRALTRQFSKNRTSARRAGPRQVVQVAEILTEREIAMNRLRTLEWRNRQLAPPRPPSRAPVLARTGGIASLTGFFGLALWLRQVSE